jgi:hypothetical protein
MNWVPIFGRMLLFGRLYVEKGNKGPKIVGVGLVVSFHFMMVTFISSLININSCRCLPNIMH